MQGTYSPALPDAGPLSLHVGYIAQIMRCFHILLLTLVAAGFSKADLGEIESFTVDSNTETTITLKWVLGTSDQDPIKYVLVEDIFFSSDIQCTSPDCQHTYEVLEPCSKHTYTVQPFYLVNGGAVTTDVFSLNGSTKGTAPGAPSSLVSIDHNHNVDLSWTPPDNVDCVEHYKVCVRPSGSINKTCETTDLNTITLHNLDKCADMIAEVRGVTPDGVEGKLLSAGFKMGYGDPSAIRDLVVGKITNNTVELQWDDPATNKLCVDKYSIDYGPAYKRIGASLTHDNHATISDLLGCTDYNFDVSPLSTEGVQGDILTVTAETLESYPLEISDIHAEYDRDQGSIAITWAPNPDDNCQFSWKVCYHDEVNPADTCLVDDGADGESLEIPLQLEACTKYDVGISGVSPSGMIGKFTYVSVWTWDEVPSEVQNLVVENTLVNSIEISYDDPLQNARCVDRYELTIDDGEAIRTMNTHHDDYFTDLEACTPYEISVTGVTRNGLVTPVATTQSTTLEGPVSSPRSFGTHDNEITETSISLVWYEPSTNSKCTGSYKLSWTGSSDGSEDIGGSGSTMPYQVIHTVDDLVCGGEYDFTLEVSSVTGGVSSDSPVTYHEVTLPC